MIGTDSKIGMIGKLGGMGMGHGCGSLQRGTDGLGASPIKIAKGKLSGGHIGGHVGGC
jgi:hypothetical protein